MTSSFVLDASVAMAWCFPDESTPAIKGLLESMKTAAAAIPGVWYLEVTNALAIAERKRRIAPAQVAGFLAVVEMFKLEVDDQAPARAFSQILSLCRTHGLTSYDAAYLDLALRRQLPLASLDDQLRAAAQAAGIEVLGK